jgi:hypothetical protein
MWVVKLIESTCLSDLPKRLLRLSGLFSVPAPPIRILYESAGFFFNDPQQSQDDGDSR